MLPSPFLSIGRSTLFGALVLVGFRIEAITLSDCLQATPAPKLILYATTGGTPLRLHVFSAVLPSPPPGQPANPAAALLIFHGGAWRAGTAESFYPQARYFASRGLVAITVDYRLLTPEGPAVRDALDDCRSAIAYVRTHAAELGVDPTRIAALGDSAGGQLAAATALCPGGRPESAPQALLLYNPVLDLTTPPFLAFIIRGAALQKNAPPSALIPTPAQAKLAAELSPLSQVRPNLPPTLLMHGLEDRIVPSTQSQLFAAAMQKAGNRCDLELIPEARHAFVVVKYTAPESLVVFALRRADVFLASLGYLEGPPTLVVSDPPAWTIEPPPARK